MSLFSIVFRFQRRPVRTTLVGAAAIAAMTTMVAAAEPGVYGRLYAGVAAVNGLSFADPATADLVLDGGSGLAYGGAVGVATNSGFRFEADHTFAEANADGTFVENVQVFVPCGESPQNPCLDGRVDGEFEAFTGFAMGFYDIDTGNGFTPYLGAGLGFMDTEIEATTPASLNDAGDIVFVLLDDSETNLAYRLAAGFAYTAGAWDLTADYSWTRSEKTNLSGSGAFISFNYDRRPTVHQFSVGARYAF